MMPPKDIIFYSHVHYMHDSHVREQILKIYLLTYEHMARIHTHCLSFVTHLSLPP